MDIILQLKKLQITFETRELLLRQDVNVSKCNRKLPLILNKKL